MKSSAMKASAMKRRVFLTTPLVLTACGSILPAQKYIAPTDWPLAPPPPPSLPFNPAGPILLLRDLSAAPGLDDQGIHTLAPDGSLAVSYYNRWAVPPAEAATASLAAWLEASGAFSAVIATGSRLTPALIVEGALTDFTADPQGGAAICVLTFAVIANPVTLAAKPRPLAQSRITGTAPLTATGAQAEVAALRVALAAALHQASMLITSFA